MTWILAVAAVLTATVFVASLRRYLLARRSQAGPFTRR